MLVFFNLITGFVLRGSILRMGVLLCWWRGVGVASLGRDGDCITPLDMV